jgi:2-polyprenyl-6-methoxyphenol hydroxylase-like FAD-dependent oxidoreductase
VSVEDRATPQPSGNRADGADGADGAETVLVVGAGMSGLALALALDGSGKRVVLIERDAEPPVLDPQDAFERWKRPGVSQFRYSHVFVGRLHDLLRDRYPILTAELEQAGLRPSDFLEGLPPTLRASYVAHADDSRMVSLCGRRATFEYVLRRHVGRLAHVRFVHGAAAQGLALERAGDVLRVVGVEVKRGDVRETLRGDVVVDAGGRNSLVQSWLQAHGGRIDVHEQSAQFAYFCRHYRLREGEVEPDHSDVSGDLDYLKYAIFFGEPGHFAVAFGCAEQEHELIALLRRADAFDALCRQFPQLARWLDRSEPVSKVLGAAKIVNRWARIASAPRVHGLFLTGDAGFEANPIYGRGCAAAFVQSHLLAETLVAEPRPERRAARHEAALRAELGPYHRASMVADQVFHDRSERARGAPATLLQRLQMHAYEHVVMPALAVDMVVVREILNVMSMGKPAGPLRIARFALRVLWSWLRGAGRAAPALPSGPPRRDLLARVRDALPAQHDDARDGALALGGNAGSSAGNGD